MSLFLVLLFFCTCGMSGLFLWLIGFSTRKCPSCRHPISAHVSARQYYTPPPNNYPPQYPPYPPRYR